MAPLQCGVTRPASVVIRHVLQLAAQVVTAARGALCACRSSRDTCGQLCRPSRDTCDRLSSRRARGAEQLSVPTIRVSPPLPVATETAVTETTAAAEAARGSETSATAPEPVVTETAAMSSQVIPDNRRPAGPSRQTLRYRFDLIDRDGNGSISGQELAEVMRQLGHHVTDAEIADIMAAVDLDGDGNLTFEEFVEVISKMNQEGEQTREQAESAMREAFKVFDRNGRGFIGVSDLRAVLHCLGERLTDEEVEDIIEEVDMDGDGRIDFTEFVRAITEDSEGEAAV